MATLSSGNGCGSNNGTKQVGSIPANPFVSVRYHFGMLLGVDDFETDQAYHRGKTWLHSSWLHGNGVVWGFDVKIGDGTDLTIAKGELLVTPGLALDGCGRELQLAETACVSLGAWYAKHKDDENLAAVLTVVEGTSENPTKVSFDAIVVAHFSACKWREVPALVEPCAGSASDTQFSRYNETVELRIIPVDATWKATYPAHYHRLRVLLGVEAPTADDAYLVTILQEIAALPIAEQGPARLDAFRKLAALDVIDIGPEKDAETGESGAPFAGLESAGVVLAHLSGITLNAVTSETDVTTWSFDSGSADTTVRRSLVSTQGIQELLTGGGNEGAAALAAVGPQIDPQVALSNDKKELFLTVDKPLHPGTVLIDSVSITSLSPLSDNNAVWKDHTVVASYDAGLSQIIVKIDDATPLPLAIDSNIRIIARGTGPAPIAGSDGTPLAGAIGQAVENSYEGRDFVTVLKGNVS